MQILKAGPSVATLRQQAMNDGFNDAVKGFAEYEQAVKHRDETMRQRAMAVGKTRMDLEQNGYDTSKLSDEQIADGIGFQKPREIGFRHMFSGSKEEAPEKANLFAERNQDWKNKQEDRQFKRKMDEADLQFKHENALLDRQYKKAQIGGIYADSKKKIADAQRGPDVKQNEYAAANFANRANQANQALSELPEDIGTGSFVDTIQGSSFFPEAMKSDNRKQLEQTQRNFISAVLRKESGASISDQEYDNAVKQYFPAPGDTSDVLALKSQARQQAISGLEAEGAPAVNRISVAGIQKPTPPPGLTNRAKAGAINEMRSQLKGLSREEKIKMLKGR